LSASEFEYGSKVVGTETKTDGEVVGTENKSDGEDAGVVSEKMGRCDHERVRVNKAWWWYGCKCDQSGTGLMRPDLIVS
jgi:hypothetical protein